MSNRLLVEASVSTGSCPRPATGSWRCRSERQQARLSAVLRPTYGRLRTDAAIIDATAFALHHWRKKAEQLAATGYRPFGASGDKSGLPNARAVERCSSRPTVAEKGERLAAP
jgi:hypothetical protein